MSPRSRREYLEAVVLRYRNADRAGKSRLLDEFCATCGHHRKHAIRLLRGFKRFTAPPPKTRGRKPVYHAPALLKPVKTILSAVMQKSPPGVIQNSPPVGLLKRRSDDGRDRRNDV